MNLFQRLFARFGKKIQQAKPANQQVTAWTSPTVAQSGPTVTTQPTVVPVPPVGPMPPITAPQEGYPRNLVRGIPGGPQANINAYAWIAEDWEPSLNEAILGQGTNQIKDPGVPPGARSPAGYPTQNGVVIFAGQGFNSDAAVAAYKSAVAQRNANLEAGDRARGAQTYGGPIQIHELTHEDMVWLYALAPYWPSVHTDVLNGTWDQIRRVISTIGNEYAAEVTALQRTPGGTQNYNSEVAQRVRAHSYTLPREKFSPGFVL